MIALGRSVSRHYSKEIATCTKLNAKQTIITSKLTITKSRWHSAEDCRVIAEEVERLLSELMDQVHKFPHVGKFMHLTWIKIAPPGLYPPPCTLPFSVHCPVHLHTGPAPPVYTTFLLMPSQLKFEPATMVFWGKFCTCCCLGENFALVPK